MEDEFEEVSDPIAESQGLIKFDLAAHRAGLQVRVIKSSIVGMFCIMLLTAAVLLWGSASSRGSLVSIDGIFVGAFVTTFGFAFSMRRWHKA